MGMYETVDGEELKMTGLLYEATTRCGVREENGTMVVHRDVVKRVNNYMLHNITKPGNGKYIDQQRMLNWWLINTNDEYLFFA